MGDFATQWDQFGKVIILRRKDGVQWVPLFIASEQHLLFAVLWVNYGISNIAALDIP